MTQVSILLPLILAAYLPKVVTLPRPWTYGRTLRADSGPTPASQRRGPVAFFNLRARKA